MPQPNLAVRMNQESASGDRFLTLVDRWLRSDADLAFGYGLEKIFERQAVQGHLVFKAGEQGLDIASNRNGRRLIDAVERAGPFVRSEAIAIVAHDEKEIASDIAGIGVLDGLADHRNGGCIDEIHALDLQARAEDEGIAHAQGNLRLARDRAIGVLFGVECMNPIQVANGEVEGPLHPWRRIGIGRTGTSDEQGRRERTDTCTSQAKRASKFD